ncbi:hypothetical protein [Helicobacter heilmannii]|uniref:Periplasmic protein n=3 Tax=Helicobacter heilmannii TaxID=35817 RepID=A0A0K2Y5N4_HELHE|nr:hypothetical protein [Helicobacter heilmannii]CCM12379.1 hypothetical protein BN341_7730 [Helicobacter heilmannii ASB1.4]CRF46528.1 hypothetical protein HHE014_15390 [Helicobacter heilmannii]CRF50442.1 hypothetical protein HHE06_02670 [Helicobacter heilmannii]CRI34476.1 hypothetical protein HHE01_13220 [Helicobacter heilmannii]
MPRFLFALICCALSLHASPTPTIKTWLQEFLNAQKPEQLAHFSTSHLEFAPYTLIGALAQVPSKKGACVGVLYQGQLFKGFCVRGFNSLKLSKEQGKLRLELVNSTPATPTMAPKDTGYTLSFALKHGTFYLTSLAPLNQSTTYETTAPIYAMGAINDKLLATLSTPATPTYASPKEFAPTLPRAPQSPSAQAPRSTKLGDYTISTTHSPKEQCVQIQKFQRPRGRFCIQGTGFVDFSAHDPYVELHFKPANAPAIALNFESFGGDLELKRYAQGGQVFYNQSTNDPHNTYPIRLSTLTPKFLENLRLK